MPIVLMLLFVCGQALAQQTILLPKAQNNNERITTQQAYYATFGDSTYLPLGPFYLEKHRHWKLKPSKQLQEVDGQAFSLGNWYGQPTLISSDSSWAHFCLANHISLAIQPNFAQQCVVISQVNADCNARIANSFYQHAGTLYWLVGNTYGGCRGMRTRFLAFIVNSPAKQLKWVPFRSAIF